MPARKAEMAQWWEHSPPTNVARVQFPVLASYVGWVSCWFLSKAFLGVLRFSLLHKNQHFQIPIRPGNSGEKSYSVDSTEVANLILFYFLYSYMYSVAD